MRLSRNFTTEADFPEWDAPYVTDELRELAAETVARVLQPIRDRFGVPVRVTSWLTWSSGELRTGSHSAGAIDFVVDDGKTREAFEWAARTLVPAGFVGRLIYEPARPATATTPRQGEHIHMAPRASMVEAFGDPAIQVLEEEAEGEYRFYRVAAPALATVAALVAAWWVFLADRPRPAST